MIAEHWHQARARANFLLLKRALKSALPKECSPKECSSSSSGADNTKSPDHDIFGEDGEPRRSSCVRCPTKNVASQISQDAKLAKAKEKKKQAKRKGKAKAMSTSQLIEEFNLESE